jgi:hypothetical protein
MLAAVLKDGEYRSLRRCQSKSGDFIAELSVTLLRDGRPAPTGMVAVFSVGGEKSDPGSAPAKREEQERLAGEDETAPTISRSIDGGAFILASPLMHRFMRMVDRVAAHTESVLVTGETGTGKELIARTIHQSSHRRSRPWVDINCAALPENLVESELFGYEKGAFTGADASKPGLFELADKGTLFLDEIGELQLADSGQALARPGWISFLPARRPPQDQGRCPHRCRHQSGSRCGRRRRPLSPGSFHRLGQFQLRVPPCASAPRISLPWPSTSSASRSPVVRIRPEAVSVLLSHTGQAMSASCGISSPELRSSPLILRYKKVQIADAMSGSPIAQRQSASMPVGNLDSMEEQMIIRALERSGGHRSQAAEQLGISRRTLSRKLKEYNINVNSGDGANSLGFISLEQQKFFRARTQLSVTLRNQQGEEVRVQG